MQLKLNNPGWAIRFAAFTLLAFVFVSCQKAEPEKTVSSPSADTIDMTGAGPIPPAIAAPLTGDAKTWELLGKVTFEKKYYEQFDQLFLFPVFSETVKSLEGKEIRVAGYVIKLEEGAYFLSKTPFSSCFFCGQGGPETVISLELPPGVSYDTDEYKTFSGTLQLNDQDVEKLNYILQKAREVK